MNSDINRTSYKRAELPPIWLNENDLERLRNLADAASDKFPRTAEFLERK